jgi:acyl carrier protein
MNPDLVRIVRRIIAENFLFRAEIDALSDSDSLLEHGVIDSTGVLELIVLLEKEFRLSVADEDVVPENLDSINRIVSYVTRKTSPTPLVHAS